jgi:hypothetical protein
MGYTESDTVVFIPNTAVTHPKDKQWAFDSSLTGGYVVPHVLLLLGMSNAARSGGNEHVLDGMEVHAI